MVYGYYLPKYSILFCGRLHGKVLSAEQPDFETLIGVSVFFMFLLNIHRLLLSA